MSNANCNKCLNAVKQSIYKPRKVLAELLCTDCEKYLCSDCIREHTDHKTFSVKDIENETKFGNFCEGLMEQFISEGDQIVEKFSQERTNLCDVVDVEGANDKGCYIKDICILHGSKKWVIADIRNNCIKVFNINNNQMDAQINLHYEPRGITEIPSTDPSQSLIAVSFPNKKIIVVMSIQGGTVQVISSINVHGKCRDLAYCNNKLITRYWNYQNREVRHSIHVMDMLGKIINNIDLHNLPGIKLKYFSRICMSVHSESETLYVCLFRDPPCVISLSLNGQVLNSIKFSDLNPSCVYVDRNQTVYVIGENFPLYKLSFDLGQTEKAIDDEIVHGFWFPSWDNFTAIACHADTFYLARRDGRVFIIRHE